MALSSEKKESEKTAQETIRLSTSTSRLLVFLKKHVGNDGLAIYAKHELALLLGTSEKTITRSIQKLLRAKAIVVVPVTMKMAVSSRTPIESSKISNTQ